MARRMFMGYAKRPFDKLFDNSTETPSADFLNKIGASLPEKMSFKTPMDNTLGTQGAIVSQPNIADSIGKVGSNLGGAMSGLSAANDFANGNYVDGGLNAAKTVAAFVPGGQPVAAAIQGAQIVKDLFGGLFGSGDDGSESLNETMNIRRNALNQTKQFAQNAQQQDYSQPVITGLAAPAEQQLTPIQEYQNALREQGYSDDIINGVPQGLNSGDKNIAQWIEQYNNGSGRDNPIRIPQTAEEIAAAKAGSFNAPTQTAGASENIKKGLLDKFINGIGDFSRGYQENRNNGFNPNNLSANKFTETITTLGDKNKLEGYAKSLKTQGYSDDVIQGVREGRNSGIKSIEKYINEHPEMYDQTTINTYDKGKMARVGEVLGTISRIAQNPAVQGLVAGGVSTALTGNPLYGVGKGYEFANNRAMSNIRRDVLKDYGVNIPDSGTFGNITSNDMRNIGNMAETQAWHEYLKKKNADELAAKLARDEVDKDYKAKRAATMQQNADTNAQKVNNKNNPSPKTYKDKWILKSINNRAVMYNERTGEIREIAGNRNGGDNNIVNQTLNEGTSGTPSSSNSIVNKALNKNKKNKNNKGWAF